MAEKRPTDTDVDTWHQTANYASFDQYQEGAGNILEHELRAGWPDKASSEQDLDATHGPINHLESA